MSAQEDFGKVSVDEYKQYRSTYDPSKIEKTVQFTIEPKKNQLDGDEPESQTKERGRKRRKGKNQNVGPPKRPQSKARSRSKSPGPKPPPKQGPNRVLLKILA